MNAADAHKRATDYSGQETQLTFFGYPDNCDSTGCYYSETAYQCSNPDGSSRNGAQGDGSYNNPLSVAFQPGDNFQQCGIIYMAYLQKFGILDGLCASCDTNHLDIWIDSSCSDDASNVCSCEDSLTPSSDQYVPPSTLIPSLIPYPPHFLLFRISPRELDILSVVPTP